MSSHQFPSSSSSSSSSPLDCRPIFHQIPSDPAPPIHTVPTIGGIGSSTSSPPMTLTPEEEVLNDLYEFTMDGDWDAVLYVYEKYKEIVQTARINSFNQTTLHLAISDSRADMVKSLLDIVDAHVIRDMIDDRKENPLHLAASLDQTDTCKLLVNKDPELIGAQNKEGETPLFIAARNGKKGAFYALHPKCPITGDDIKHDIRHCKRNDGNTILHVAILGEYFELAFQIIYWYPELMESHNQKGQTALHLLAQNPSAFKSWCDMGFVEDFIYNCLIADKARFEKPSDFKEEHRSNVTSPIRGNCKIRLDSLIMAWKKVINAIVNTAWKWKAIAGNKDVQMQQLPVQSTMDTLCLGKDKRQAMEDPNPDNKVEEQSMVCDRDHINDMKDQSTPFLIAAKMGVLEIVQGIMEHHPMAIHQEDVDKKNAVLLAVEHKHPRTYKLLREKYSSYQSIFQKLDKNENSAFHLAAKELRDHTWRIHGAALQIQWDLKWYNHIESTMPYKSLARQKNDKGKTAMEVFHEEHKEMVKDGVQWLINTSQSCSVIAALVASVAYASATTVPGGLKEGTAIPLLRGQPAFNVFIISSLLALCLSVTSLTMFLSILTSRYQTSDFLRNLPRRLILGLSSLFVAIAAMLVSFSAGHFFDLEEQLRRTALPIYAVICLPVSLYAMTQFRLYIDLIKSFIPTVPQRSHDKLTI
ncbi:serine/threonine-protein phosphatase 6 regulatory ankyrin repeat subunit B-like protein [Cinnamomum micranthum f. kanehirae]|uniref:Serine/threonine-protein phosphatase 6 regulatory ankyrin repeat subunit B-like protein n=1 Tax=Cinnamomum micranthum f. kanehirae TaxID=337451 RepID=A0A443NAS3_9MAGN|nr:serine/threonine-protein phosphatase 6 regulatory ankyrin repeat subunit B-like protein [Cinnamomum micranthum f. kanehirae]